MPGGPGRPAAVLDTCVLYPATVRNLLLNLAEQRGFAPAWSDRILGELGGALTRTPDPRMSPEQWENLNLRLRTRFPAAVTPAADVRRLEATMTNDPKDRHVLAAAVASGASTVVTTNLRDFPSLATTAHGVRAVHPDRFLSESLERSPARLERALAVTAAAVRHEGRAWSVGQVLGHLGGLGRARAITPGFVAGVESVLGISATAPPVSAARGAGRPLERGRAAPERGRGGIDR